MTTVIKRLGYLAPNKTVFLLCDVQEKFAFMNYFTEFTKNIKKVVRLRFIMILTSLKISTNFTVYDY